jgi:signal transduction histidine kinase
MADPKAVIGRICVNLIGASIPPVLLSMSVFVTLMLAPLDDVVDATLLATLRVTSGLAFAAISALGIWAGVTFVSPARQVALRARALADGDLSSPVPNRGRNDEIDWIADSIVVTASTMRELEASRTMLRDLNHTLEMRVADRTAELSASNRRLEQALADIGAVQRELVRRERLASLGSMVAGLAHELNTPIGNAMTCASVLSREVRAMRATGTVDPWTVIHKLERTSELLERSLGRAVELISSFKQVSVDQASAQRRRFELHDAVRALHDTVSPVLRRSPIRLRIAVPAGIALDSYPGPLEQALYNLVNNAFVHAFEGRTAGAVEIAAETAGDQVRITVEDDGVGIPPDAQPFIFDPFYTTRMGSGGSGLGLHMVYTTVTTLLGGRVEVDSAPGRGTRVHLVVPTVAPHSRAA